MRGYIVRLATPFEVRHVDFAASAFTDSQDAETTVLVSDKDKSYAPDEVTRAIIIVSHESIHQAFFRIGLKRRHHRVLDYFMAKHRLPSGRLDVDGISPGVY